MAVVVQPQGVDISSYRDQQFKGTRTEQERKLLESTTLYVGNLSFYTTEEQIYELFSKCGDIKKIIMGLDRFKRTPCGFCFLEYYTRIDAENAVRYINGTRLDDRLIRTDWDAGFIEGRQYGRGKTGGQLKCESIASKLLVLKENGSIYISCINTKAVKPIVTPIESVQVRDEYRADYDAGRGGYGKIIQTKLGV